MPQSLSPTSAAPASGIVFAPGEKFFVRRIALAPEIEPAEQVTLALEGFSPFPTTQLYYGFRTNRARTEALVFAAYRKNFSPEEIGGWVDAVAVLPDFAASLGGGEVSPMGLVAREKAGQVEWIAWDGRSELPALVAVRPPAADQADAERGTMARRAGLDANVGLKSSRAALQVSREKRELVLRLAGTGVETHWDEAALSHADIRDKEVLVARRQSARRDLLLWRGFAALVCGLAACAVIEGGLLATRYWLAGQQTQINLRTPDVKRVEQTQSMTRRLEEISTQRLLPFEMLDAINNKRPRSLEFSSVTTKGLWQLDIQGQAGNAEDTATFETDVRHLPGIERVEVVEKRTREGVTAFRYEITFKPGWQKIAKEGA